VRTACRNYSIVRDTVIDIDVARMMREDRCRRAARDHRLDPSYDVEQVDGIEAVIGEREDLYGSATEDGARPLGCGDAGLDPVRSGCRVTNQWPRPLPVGENQDVDRPPFVGETRERTAATQHLVVRVSRNDHDWAAHCLFLIRTLAST